MGLYIHGLLENNLYEKDMEYTIQKLCFRLNKKLFITHNHITPLLPKDIDDFIVADLFYTDTINDEIKEDSDIWIDIYDKNYFFHVILSKTGVIAGHFEFKWHFFDNYLQGDTWLKEYFTVHIEDIIQIGKLFNSKQLLLYPDELLEVSLEMKVMQEGYYLDEVLKKLEDCVIVTDENLPLPERDEIIVYQKYIETNNLTLTIGKNIGPTVKSQKFSMRMIDFYMTKLCVLATSLPILLFSIENKLTILRSLSLK